MRPKNLTSAAPALIAASFLWTAACVEESSSHGIKSDANETSAPAAFALKSEVDPSTLDYTRNVDLNLGHTPEKFVRALWKQLTGEDAEDAWVRNHAAKLGSKEFPRRIDLALLLAQEAGEDEVRWAYSDPWVEQIDLVGSPEKTIDRDLGAVFMFFFSSPNRPNGGTGWSNNHAPGMLEPKAELNIDEQEATSNDGYYHPHNAAFWYRELRDARYAGFDFLLPNVYGPDLDAAQMKPMQIALAKLREEDGDDVIKLGMFDDTWTWGQPWFTPFWEQKPDCNDVEATAKLLFEAKWKPYFRALPREHWYLVEGKPMIYFYNNNTLQNKENFDQVLPTMKQHFKDEFGVEPWVAVDTAFNYRPTMKTASDSHFKWYTFDLPEKFASETRNDITLSHAMPRWDSTSRWNDYTEIRAKKGDLLVKDAAVLKQVLDATTESDILVLATWNDLGEGTGINRCYDYYFDGEWKQPDYFMQYIRRSQMGERLLNE